MSMVEHIRFVEWDLLGQPRLLDEGLPMDIRDSYDSAAAAYAAHLADELDCKPLDRHLLNRFAEATRAASGSLT